MEEAIACVAERVRDARRAAADVAERLPGFRIRPCSLSSYLASPSSPRRIVLFTAGHSLEEDLAFLRRAARRILLPAPPADFREAIAGIRTRDERAGRTSATRTAPSARGGLAAALLLEGPVDAARARAALRPSTPRDWIVESAAQIRIPGRLLTVLSRAGIRWSALETVEVVALYAAAPLVRARSKWKALLPPRTRVWVREARGMRREK